MPAFNALTVPVLKPVAFAFSITFCALSTQTGIARLAPLIDFARPN
jgi:hypothetical protein